MYPVTVHKVSCMETSTILFKVFPLQRKKIKSRGMNNFINSTAGVIQFFPDRIIFAPAILLANSLQTGVGGYHTKPPPSMIGGKHRQSFGAHWKFLFQ